MNRPESFRGHRPATAGVWLLTAHLVAGTVAASAAPTGEAPTAELRRTAPAFGGTAAVEVRGLSPLTAAIAVAAAFEEIQEVERLAASAGGGALPVGAPLRLDPRLARLLDRARSFCLWSGNAHGPLGGRLYELWRPSEGGGRPTPAALVAAVESARCRGLEIDPAAGVVRIPEGSSVDLTGFAAGFAADRAGDALRAAGATNGVVEVGSAVLAFGPGPEGRGWPVELPSFPGLEGPLDRLLLRDQAVAVAAAAAQPLSIAGDRYAGFLDQRTGRPVEGVLATVAAAELAVDAEALSVTAMILGSREGTFLLGQLQPTPAVLWLLGSGTGHPLITNFHWSQIRKE